MAPQMPIKFRLLFKIETITLRFLEKEYSEKGHTTSKAKIWILEEGTTAKGCRWPLEDGEAENWILQGSWKTVP